MEVKTEKKPRDRDAQWGIATELFSDHNSHSYAYPNSRVLPRYPVTIEQQQSSYSSHPKETCSICVDTA